MKERPGKAIRLGRSFHYFGNHEMPVIAKKGCLLCTSAKISLYISSDVNVLEPVYNKLIND